MTRLPLHQRIVVVAALCTRLRTTRLCARRTRRTLPTRRTRLCTRLCIRRTHRCIRLCSRRRTVCTRLCTLRTLPSGGDDPGVLATP